MTIMFIPALHNSRQIAEQRRELEACILRIKHLEQRVGFTAKNERASHIEPQDARKRLEILEQRVEALRGNK